MHASVLVALWAASAAASAIPAVTPAAVIEKRADQTAAWVSVDNNGQPERTYTPYMTVKDGTTEVRDGAPHDLTASVYTFTEWGKITTSTGQPPVPTATNAAGKGAFSRCVNMEGDNAPFCDPYVNSTLYAGNTYYVTWDPDFYNKTGDNSTWEVAPLLDWLNHTSNQYEKIKEFNRIPAEWGYFAFHIESSYLKGYRYINASITLMSSEKGSAKKENSTMLPINLSVGTLPKNPTPHAPKGEELTIALPTVFGAIVILLVGGCLWNRKTRRIQLGNIMSRNRHGYTGRKQRRLFRSRKDEGAIQLDTRGTGPAGEYSDMPHRPRRDSDGLGSLVNSPVDPTFRQQGTSGGGNTFRDEVRRQEQERAGRF